MLRAHLIRYCLHMIAVFVACDPGLPTAGRNRRARQSTLRSRFYYEIKENNRSLRAGGVEEDQLYTGHLWCALQADELTDFKLLPQNDVQVPFRGQAGGTVLALKACA